MNIDESLKCPICNSKNFLLKHESTYLYTYKFNEKDIKSNEEFLPYLFDNREHVNLKQYLQCEHCGSQFPCTFDMASEKISLTIMQKAVRSDYVKSPEFFG
ncbi:hypothetical protein [Clostridium amazonitimonense]|uniref:hypothetical protein n=1 Tax=Clostridium amazonitimonense TaxID=1499689 RepID=UPI0005A7230E|nr:hypothetical protein [Clostridium amazonitimonense]